LHSCFCQIVEGSFHLKSNKAVKKFNWICVLKINLHFKIQPKSRDSKRLFINIKIIKQKKNFKTKSCFYRTTITARNLRVTLKSTESLKTRQTYMQEPTPKRKKAVPSIPLVSRNTQYMHTGLLFDETLLGAYNLNAPVETASVVSTTQMLYQNGSDALRSGLHRLTTELYEHIRSHTDLLDRIQELQCNTDTQVGILQTALSNEQVKYERLAEMVSEMETKASMTEQLQHDKRELASQCHDIQTQLLGKQKRIDELVSKEATLQNVSQIFRSPTDRLPIQYPVMQSNGLIVDFYQVMSTWAKTGEEDDGYPYRTYTCHVTKDQTSLARISITSKIQEIATGIGMQLIPPMEFEFKNAPDAEWAKLGLMDQVSVIAKLCSMYTARVNSATIVVNNDQIYFNMCLDKVKL